MKLFREHRASSFNESEDKTLTKSEAPSQFSHHQPLIGVANPSVASSCYSTAKPGNNNKLPDSLLQVLEYLKGRHEVGPPIYLGDDPEPGDTVYDTTVNPLPLSPSKPVPGHIPRHERTQLQPPVKTREDSSAASAFKAGIISEHKGRGQPNIIPQGRFSLILTTDRRGSKPS